MPYFYSKSAYSYPCSPIHLWIALDHLCHSVSKDNLDLKVGAATQAFKVTRKRHIQITNGEAFLNLKNVKLR